jgi:hypothetical protein
MSAMVTVWQLECTSAYLVAGVADFAWLSRITDIVLSRPEKESATSEPPVIFDITSPGGIV